MADPAAVRPPDHGGLLMVDDEPFLCNAVAASLRFLGFEVTTAQTGAEALRLARDRPFDLVVLDVMLPDTDGFEIITRLRRDGCQVPVIFLTAKDTQEDKVTGLTLGGDDYLTKPFGLEELAARIRTVLRRTRPATTGPVLAFADIELNQDSYEVRRRGHLIDLSPTGGGRCHPGLTYRPRAALTPPRAAGTGGRAATLGAGRGRPARDLAIKPGRPGDDDGPRWPVAGDGEAVHAVAGHEDEAARRGRPAVIAAVAGQLALEQVEHLVLTGVQVRVDRQGRWVGELHHAQLAQGVTPRCLDHDAGAVEVIGLALTGPEHESGHDR
jgi:CheY-like chemotaxis protein